ncbi:MAG TPA: hypothetical protein IGS52_03985 [Oscillatoriaceae cyanobacterium M33_DOE_052]|uniref:Uncharacterized protein n=1 Tax=Planktothricoides sp. SpSt-374 TaxID=2282167 RepID=A0A7C3VLJ8_9CYAN|nr:hypothetical protein [Oscillatoriaceae cyanobacterium M33_DOE_052]
MIITDLNHIQVVDNNQVQGGWYSSPYTYYENDFVQMSFSSNNNFSTSVNSPYTLTNSASAGAKGDAINNTNYSTYSYTKADTIAVAEFLGGSFSASTSAAVINGAW